MSKFQKPFLSPSDVVTLKRYAIHIAPFFEDEGCHITHADLLFLIANELGYKNWEDLHAYNQSDVLFTDIFQLLHAITPSLIKRLLNENDVTKQGLTTAQAQKYLTENFNPSDNSEWLRHAQVKNGPINVKTLLLPKGSGVYAIIFFNSYVDLALRLESELEDVSRNQIRFDTTFQPGLSAKTKHNKAPVRYTYPVYAFLQSMIPSGSVFLAETDHYVVGFDYVLNDDIDIGLSMFSVVFQLCCDYPLSINYTLGERGAKQGLVPYGNHRESDFWHPLKPYQTEAFNKDGDGDSIVFFSESLFQSVPFRGPLPSSKSYTDCCDQMIRTLFSY